jgi:nitrite reductase/ring-hydroxylating ferredoxin subunit
MVLTKEENELLTRVGAGTPMGEWVRRYWLPALLTEEIPEPDCPPVRVKLLGEDLVAFRDTEGRIGLISEYCCHRRASLFYGRNEEGGLRCIYHGWKYDVDGAILDTPAEPANSMIKHHVRSTAYPCHEANGIVYTYMGPKERMPLVPNFEWITLPRDHVRSGSKYYNDNNWLQGLEGDCDSSHVEFLHRSAGTGRTVGGTLQLKPGFGSNLAFDVEKGPWYVAVAANRFVEDGLKYVRTNWFVPPCVGIIPTGRTVNGIIDGMSIKYQVPLDDYTTARYDILTSRSRPFDPSAFRWSHEVGPDFRKLKNRANEYMIDREKQRGTVYSGIDGSTHIQDACVTESMGPITDRTQEHLGECDAQILAMREFLLRSVRAVQRGEDPAGLAWDAAHNTFGDIFIVNALLPLDAKWNDRAEVMQRALEHSLSI